MNTIDLEVDDAVLRVSFGPGRPVEVVENAMVLRDDRKIEAVGAVVVPEPRPNSTHRAYRPFGVDAFDPILAEAAIVHFVGRHDQRSGPWLPWLLRRGAVRLRWSDWSRLAPVDRRSFLQRVGRHTNVEINGRVAVRGAWWRSVLGKDPVVEGWAIA